MAFNISPHLPDTRRGCSVIAEISYRPKLRDKGARSAYLAFKKEDTFVCAVRLPAYGRCSFGDRGEVLAFGGRPRSYLYHAEERIDHSVALQSWYTCLPRPFRGLVSPENRSG